MPMGPASNNLFLKIIRYIVKREVCITCFNGNLTKQVDNEEVFCQNRLMSKESIEKSKWDTVWRSKQTSYDNLLDKVKYLRRTLLVEKFLSKSDRILEAGCGDGKFVFYFDSLGYNITGIDYVESAIQRNIELALKSGLKATLFETADICRLDSYKGQFDIYLSMGVIEHFKENEQQLIIRNAHTALRNGGKVVVTVPNLYSPWTIARCICFFFSKNMPYQKNISRFRIKKMFEKEGFETITVFNAEVSEALRMASRIDQKKFKMIPNPLYYLQIACKKLTTEKIGGFRNPLYFARKVSHGLSILLDKIFPIIGYNTYYVGQVKSS